MRSGRTIPTIVASVALLLLASAIFFSNGPRGLIQPDGRRAGPVASGDAPAGPRYERMSDGERYELLDQLPEWLPLGTDPAGAGLSERVLEVMFVCEEAYFSEEGVAVSQAVRESLAEEIVAFGHAQANAPEGVVEWVERSGRTWAPPDDWVWESRREYARLWFDREPLRHDPAADMTQSMRRDAAECGKRWRQVAIGPGGGSVVFGVARDESTMRAGRITRGCFPIEDIDARFGIGSSSIPLSRSAASAADLLRDARGRGVLVAMSAFVVRTDGGRLGVWVGEWAYEAGARRWHLINAASRYARTEPDNEYRSRCGFGFDVMY